MVRRRFMSKGSATFVDGLDETIASRPFPKSSLFQFQRPPILEKLLNDALAEKKRPRKKDRDKPADQTNIDKEELYFQQLCKEIQEAEEYSLIIEVDDSIASRNSSISPSNSRISQTHSVESESPNKSMMLTSGRFSGFKEGNGTDENLSLAHDENENPIDLNESPVLFSAHPAEPTTSTPIQKVWSARISRHHQSMFITAQNASLSPIIPEKEDVTYDINEKMASSSYHSEKKEEESEGEQKDDTSEEKSLSSSKEGIKSVVVKTPRGTLSQLTILKSPGQWGFGDDDYACEEIVSSLSAQYNRSLSLCDFGDNRPFYLSGFPWTAGYAKRRDYKKELLYLCVQENIQSWLIGKSVLDLSYPVKLGEGTFGEVFRIKYNGGIVALKVIPIGGTKIVNGDKQKSFRDIAAELIVSKELSDLRDAEDGYSTKGFIRLKGALVVKGCYPKSLVSAWEQYDKSMKSENDHPCIFKSTQHFLLLAFEDGGTDLEKYMITSVLQAYSIVYQVLIALSVAEYRLSFEHRDLHCGNILIRNVESNTVVKADYDDAEVSVHTNGAEVKIIDFTLSRLSKGTSTIFYDLAKDDELFTGEGCLQYDIYRAMRLANKNSWFPFCSITNVMWLIYLVRYIYDRMDEDDIGSEDERKNFVFHFKDLHRYDSLREWIAEKGGRKNDIIQVADRNR